MTRLGINEKSLPFSMNIVDKALLAKENHFDFLELSIDESEDRLNRLDWSDITRKTLVEGLKKIGVPINTIMLSGLRKYPLGSQDNNIYEIAYNICFKAICLAEDLGISTIQIAGYDEFYNEKNTQTEKGL